MFKNQLWQWLHNSVTNLKNNYLDALKGEFRGT